MITDDQRRKPNRWTHERDLAVVVERRDEAVSICCKVRIVSLNSPTDRRAGEEALTMSEPGATVAVEEVGSLGVGGDLVGFDESTVNAVARGLLGASSGQGGVAIGGGELLGEHVATRRVDTVSNDDAL